MSLRNPRKRKEKPQQRRTRLLRGRYGITPMDYERMLAKQSGLCAVCGRPAEECSRGLFVDHCHDTGRVRGLLCQHCNSGIGHLKDNPRIVAKALAYLEAPDTCEVQHG